MVAKTKHGITTVDSGPGPIYYVILRDDQGDVYKVATVDLGFDASESFMSIYKENMKVGDLSSGYFRKFYRERY